MSLRERFLNYVRLDTQADETSTAVPSTAKQLVLSRLLADECRQLGLTFVDLTPEGTVYATIPSTVSHVAPTICWLAHVDTSPEYSAENVTPVVHEHYPGGNLALPGDSSKVIRLAENPELKALVGATIITSDGTTLLGADDKAGIAVIMTAAERLLADPSISHGPIRLCFTCDEEIGRGCDHVDLAKVGSVCAYTLDSDGVGRVDVETFSADQAIVTVEGINTHPSIGKGAMVNAVRILSTFLADLPTATDSPETTDGRRGFLHPYHIEGGVANAEARIILRDFETAKLAEYASLLERIADRLRRQHPKARITVAVRPQYRNMREGLAIEPRAVEFALEATRSAGIEPRREIIRGGTDGSRLTEMGLPTPNLSCGQHNPHSPLEWTTLEEMETAVGVLIELAKRWGLAKVQEAPIDGARSIPCDDVARNVGSRPPRAS
ncbi:MAG: peptidase T [Planctomycetaceae bacterium]